MSMKMEKDDELLPMEWLPDVWQPIERWMQLHPRYHAVFRLSIDQLFYGNGPLTLSDRHYIALMASARHGCHFLHDLHSREFIRLGGDRSWLSGGVESAPRRIAALDVVNRLLAHQPWTVTAVEITMLVRDEKWSLSTLMQAALILSHTHALCSFVLAIGDVEPSESSNRLPIEQSQPIIKAGEVEQLMFRMQQLKTTVKQSDADRARRFADVHREASELAPSTSTSNTFKDMIASSSSPLFSLMPNFAYVDFAQRCTPDASPALKIHDFSWEDHGFSCIYEFYQDMAELLDSKFHLTQELTYNTMGSHENVDTSKYRTAIWMYIQSLYGVRHDDYDYAEVNVMLSREMKVFIKTTCCFPERCTTELRASVMNDFKLSEKVHVLLMITESRLQTELLYLVRAFTRQLNHHQH